MTSQELGTIFQSQVGVKIILMNNGFLGMVRQWQELFYDKRYSFTELTNPDFELLAKANHIAYRCVERHEDLDDAVANGCTEIWELAERFSVPEEFIKKAVCYHVHGNVATELYF